MMKLSSPGCQKYAPPQSLHFQGRAANAAEIMRAEGAVLQALQQKNIRALLGMICERQGSSPLFYISGHSGIKHEADYVRIEDAYKGAQAALLDLAAESPVLRSQIISWLDGQYKNDWEKFSPKFFQQLFIPEAERTRLNALVEKWAL